MELLSVHEIEEFWKYLKLLTETVVEFFYNTYDLHVASIENGKINCHVFSVDALDKFQKDVNNDTASLNLEMALQSCETDPVPMLKLPANEYFQAKEFLSNLDRSDYQQT